jgi:twitching motility two-component system response regulator PilH
MATILVIEDSSFQRKIIAKVLTEQGYTVVMADNGRSGIQKIEEIKPDCVITDLLMPEFDGFQVLEELQAKKVTIPVIVLTSDIQKTTENRCKALGAAAVINKPVNQDTVIQAVQTAIR